MIVKLILVVFVYMLKNLLYVFNIIGVLFF